MSDTPTKTQLNKISKLGGDPNSVNTRDDADEYIDELEDQKDRFEDRVQHALDWVFVDPLDPSLIPVKKPTKAIMADAIRYGDEQGWGDEWESQDGATEIDLIIYAVYQVAPQLLKKNERPPRLPGQSKGIGSFIFFIITFVGISLWLLRACTKL